MVQASSPLDKTVQLQPHPNITLYTIDHNVMYHRLTDTQWMMVYTTGGQNDCLAFLYNSNTVL